MRIALTTIAMTALCASPVAFADGTNCGGNACNPNPNPTPSGFTFELDGYGEHFGGAASMFDGESGFAEVQQDGGASIDTVLEGAGNGCDPDCSDINWSFDSNAWQTSSATGYGYGETAGTTVLTQSEGAVGGALGVRFQRGQFTGSSNNNGN